MSLLENVREQSRAKGITIAELEKEAGLAENTIYKWDKVNPSVDKVQRVAMALETTIDELLSKRKNEVRNE